jgi:hypothetical protein
MKDLVISLLGEEDAEAFALWAFGESYESLLRLLPKLMHKWNERHGHLLLLEGSSKAVDSIFKMIELWKEREEK